MNESELKARYGLCNDEIDIANRVDGPWYTQYLQLIKSGRMH